MGDAARSRIYMEATDPELYRFLPWLALAPDEVANRILLPGMYYVGTTYGGGGSHWVSASGAKISRADVCEHISSAVECCLDFVPTKLEVVELEKMAARIRAKCPVLKFLAQNYLPSPGSKLDAEEVFDNWKRWRIKRRLDPMPERQFREQLAANGVKVEGDTIVNLQAL